MKARYFVVVAAAIGLMLAIQVQAAPLFVNTATGIGSTNSNVSTTLNVSSGNLLVLFCRHAVVTSTVLSATDTIGNTFSPFGTATSSNQGGMTAFWAISSSSNASDIINCAFSASVGAPYAQISQYSGIAHSPLDQVVSNATNTSLTSFSAGPFTTAQSSEVIVGGASIASANQTMTAGAGYTMVASSTNFGASGGAGTEYQIVNTIQTNVSTTINSAAVGPNWLFVVGTFKAAAPTSSDALFFAGD